MQTNHSQQSFRSQPPPGLSRWAIQQDPLLQLVLLLDEMNRDSGFKVVPRPSLEDIAAFRYSGRANPSPTKRPHPKSSPLP